MTEYALPHSAKPRATALKLKDLVVLTALSTALFIIYPTLLWHSDAHSAHTMRFTVSYLAVIPAAAAMLFARKKRVAIVDLIAAVLIVWSAKMLITVGLYHVFVVSGRPDLSAPHAVGMVETNTADYLPLANFVGRSVAGKVSGAAGRPLPSAVVELTEVSQGKALPEPRDIHVTWTPAGFSPSLAIASVGDQLSIANTDAQTQILRAAIDGHTLFNIAAVPNSEQRQLVLRKPGTARLSTSGATSEGSAYLVIAKTPYITLTQSDGSFRFENVPASATRLRVGTVDSGGEIRWKSVTIDGDQPEVLINLEATTQQPQ